MKCLQHGYRVAERPTHESRRQGGNSKISVMRVAHLYVLNLIQGVLVRRTGDREIAAGSDPTA